MVQAGYNTVQLSTQVVQPGNWASRAYCVCKSIQDDKSHIYQAHCERDLETGPIYSMSAH